MGTDIELGPRPGLSAPDRLERITDVVSGFVLVSLAVAIGSRLSRGDGARSWSILSALQHDWRALLAGVALVATVGVVWGRLRDVQERVHALDGRSRAATMTSLVLLGSLVPVGSLWMTELTRRPARSEAAVTLAVLVFLVVGLLLGSWGRFAADRELAGRWTADESKRLRRSFAAALLLVALVGAVGYFVPIAGPLLLVLAALALPLAASDELVRRPARRRKGAGPSLPDAGSSDEE